MSEDLKDDGLTDEERAALAEGNDTDDVIEEDQDGQDDAADEDSPGRDDGQPAAEEPAEEVVDEDREEVRPLFTAEAPADAEAKLSEIDASKSALDEQFDSGDITIKEYRAQMEALNSQVFDLKLATAKAEIATDMERQQAHNTWMAEVNKFLAEDHGAQGAIYSKSELAKNALDLVVRKLAALDENKGISGRKLLEKSHAMVAAEFGWADTKKDPEPAKTTKQKVEIPPSLGKMPAAEMSDTSSNRFAALERLLARDPVAYEEAVGKLSKADQEAYLASP